MADRVIDHLPHLREYAVTVTTPATWRSTLKRRATRSGADYLAVHADDRVVVVTAEHFVPVSPLYSLTNKGRNGDKIRGRPPKPLPGVATAHMSPKVVRDGLVALAGTGAVGRVDWSAGWRPGKQAPTCHGLGVHAAEVAALAARLYSATAPHPSPVDAAKACLGLAADPHCAMCGGSTPRRSAIVALGALWCPSCWSALSCTECGRSGLDPATTAPIGDRRTCLACARRRSDARAKDDRDAEAHRVAHAAGVVAEVVVADHHARKTAMLDALVADEVEDPTWELVGAALAALAVVWRRDRGWVCGRCDGLYDKLEHDCTEVTA